MNVQELKTKIELRWGIVTIGCKPIVDIIDNNIYLGHEDQAMFDFEVYSELTELDPKTELIIHEA